MFSQRIHPNHTLFIKHFKVLISTRLERQAHCLKTLQLTEAQPSNRSSEDGCSRGNADIWAPLTWTRIQSADSDGVRLAVQTQSDGVVSGVAQSLPLLRPVTARHRALHTGYTVTVAQAQP